MTSFPVLLLAVLVQPLPILAMTIFDTQDGFQAFHVASPIFNQNVGRQDFDYVVGPIVYTRNFQLCELSLAERTALARGKIVLIDRYDGQFWDLGAARRNTECLTKAGARAVIKAYHKIRVPGMGFRAKSLPTQDPDSSIPLFHITFGDIPASVVERIRFGENTVIANITADPNEWEEMWGSVSFQIIWTILLPLVNFVGILLGCTACGILSLHMRSESNRKTKLSALKRKMRHSNMRLLMLSNIILTGTCFTRMFYCLSGPLYSSNEKSMNFHLVLLDVTLIWESSASVAAIMIFHFWSSFGMPRGERKIHTMLGIMAIVAFPFYLVLTIIYAVRETRTGVISLIVKPALLTSISGIVAVIYVYRVLKFLRQTMMSSSQTNQKHRNHIGTFISIASAMSLTAFWGFVVAEMTEVGLTVQGRFISFTVIFISLTLQAISQVIAFFPSTRILQKHQAHEQNTSAQGPRRESHSRPKPSQDNDSVQPEALWIVSDTAIFASVETIPDQSDQQDNLQDPDAPDQIQNS